VEKIAFFWLAVCESFKLATKSVMLQGTPPKNPPGESFWRTGEEQSVPGSH